ncbi:MAG: crosslink repair DNA glycosylase YcaQ family protein [Rheinheimera sp.]|nr:crosslink repair DNA glycosylase YcaQ family protein [Rheinheimera sp.]
MTTALPLAHPELLQLLLARQGLSKPLTGRSGVLQAIEQLGYVQIDSINVVERAHHHVLFNRVKNYQPQWLDDLLQQKQLFEYWSHAAAFLPMRDFRFSLYRKAQLQQGQKHWFAPDHQQMQEVRARIRAEGPLKAADFAKTNEASGPWWDWQPAKKALEQLFMQGELMVVRRERFQKVLDLTERVLPAGVDCRVPDEQEYAGHLIEQFLVSHAVGTAAQISYLRPGMKTPVAKLLQELAHSGLLASFQFQGQRYYGQAGLWQLPAKATAVYLLNPFDNLLIQRQRLQHWFGADYQLEVYVPAEKRQFGYYSLPVFYGTAYAGLVDVKAQRSEQRLLLQHLQLDKQWLSQSRFCQQFTKALGAYAHFNGCTEVVLVRAETKLTDWFNKEISPRLRQSAG